MEKILISEIRIDGFRGLKNFKMSLSETTVLTGVNNVGKTTILQALRLLFGDSSFLSSKFLHIENGERSNRIIVDAKIIAINENGERVSEFSDKWGQAIGTFYLRKEEWEYDYLPLRVIYTFQPNTNSFLKESVALNLWDDDNSDWKELEGEKFTFKDNCIQFYYLEGKRDIQEDLKERNSYLNRMLGEVSSNFNPDDAALLEQKIRSLNKEVVEKSETLKNIEETLKGIDSTIDSSGKVSVSPFAKQLRDLDKTLTIHYGTDDNSFTMDCHGKGTRSWSSLLSFKAFINQLCERIDPKEAFLPIIAIEEPEANLYPYAQRQLYRQMKELPGLKIISTHSPYVAASADLSEIRGIYKTTENTLCGRLPIEKLSKEEQRKIKQAVLNSHGELLFAKAIILSEGETEGQALPIFCEKYLGRYPFDLAISFVDAKGCGNYYPFIAIASAFHIPWFIFSDGEQTTINGLNKLLKKVYGTEKKLEDQKNIFVIPEEKDFEGMLLYDGYEDEIEMSIEQLLEEEGFIDKFINDYNHKSKGRVKTSKKCETCNQYIYQDVERIYDGEKGRLSALYDIMQKNKAQLAPILATCIVENNMSMPPLVIELFDRIKEDIDHV